MSRNTDSARPRSRLTKWMPRLFSLLLLAFYLWLWFFNEDVREAVSLPVIFQGVLNLVLLAAWRWPRQAGQLVVAGGFIFFWVIMVNWLDLSAVTLWSMLVGGLLLSAPYVLIGLLFYDSGRNKPFV